jgi:uncharacterized alpha-E superfamily protein
MTLRLLDVKYFVLLPETDVVGGGRDRYQWTSVLMATSALRAYHWAYRGDYSPWRIVDFLLLNKSFPRSVAFCAEEVALRLDRLAGVYGETKPCHATADETLRLLSEIEIGEVFQQGLHEFLTERIRDNTRLSNEIAEAYYF